MLDPEAGVSLWLSPRWTLGAAMGDDLLQPGLQGLDGRVDLVFHLIPFERS
jgi:hypothetical protein